MTSTVFRKKASKTSNTSHCKCTKWLDGLTMESDHLIVIPNRMENEITTWFSTHDAATYFVTKTSVNTWSSKGHASRSVPRFLVQHQSLLLRQMYEEARTRKAPPPTLLMPTIRCQMPTGDRYHKTSSDSSKRWVNVKTERPVPWCDRAIVSHDNVMPDAPPTHTADPPTATPHRAAPPRGTHQRRFRRARPDERFGCSAKWCIQFAVVNIRFDFYQLWVEDAHWSHHMGVC